MNNQQQAMVDGPQNNKKSMKQRASGLFGAYWRTACLPGIGPRLKTLGARFGHFAYLLAMIYGAVRLIKPEHPVLNPANIGKFGFRDVISAAAENVVVSRQTIDQVLIFGAVIFGLIAIVAQIGLIVVWAGLDFYAGTAQAQEIGSLFDTPNQKSDLAFIFLDHVFGVDMFGQGLEPTRFHDALHAMMSMFSMAMLVIAVFILIYFIFVVVGEAAMTGTPFGKRFNGFYAPIRLVLAFGLLIPLANGLNTAQYATLYVAKMGSGMATQGWITFAKAFLEQKDILANPSIPALDELVTDVFVSELCAFSYSNTGRGATGTSSKYGTGWQKMNKILVIRPDLASGAALLNPLDSTVSASSIKRINLGLGEIADRDQFIEEIEKVIPPGRSGTVSLYYASKISPVGNIPLNNRCGRFETKYYNTSNDEDAEAATVATTPTDGVSAPFELPDDQLMLSMDVEMKKTRADFLVEMFNIISDINKSENGGKTILEELVDQWDPTSKNFGTDAIQPSDIPNGWLDKSKARMANRANVIRMAINQQVAQIKLDQMVAGGWVAAPIWFNRIASLNNKFVDVMSNSAPERVYEPKILGHLFIDETDKKALKNRKKKTNFTSAQANIMEAGITWYENSTEINISQSKQGSGRSFLVNMVSTMIGGGVHHLSQNPSTNPMADLAAIGSTLITRSIIGMGMIIGVNIIYSDLVGIDGITGILTLLVTVGIGAGFTLAYILPLTPFMYFLFAVSGWVSEIFEAMVAMPLWALAHLRIDGDGLMGAAATGYQLIFGIFTRPIFIMFGLMGSYLIFNGSMALLHSMFGEVVASIEGNSPGFLDKFFYMIVYVIVAYNLCITSFKLIDAVPNQILRWMGLNAPGFNDGRENPLANLGQAATVAGGLVGREGASAGAAAGRGAGGAAPDPDSPTAGGRRGSGIKGYLGRHAGGGAP